MLAVVRTVTVMVPVMARDTVAIALWVMMGILMLMEDAKVYDQLLFFFCFFV